MMAKKQKSKLLAMALCASVMAGLYANPVFAGDATISADSTNGIVINVNNVGDPNNNAGLYVDHSQGNNYTIGGSLTITPQNIVDALSNSDLTLNKLETNELTVNGQTIDLTQLADLRDVDLSNVKGIERTGDGVPGSGTTTIEKVLSVDGTTGEIYNADSTFGVDKAGNVDATAFHANTGDVTTASYSLNTVGANTQDIIHEGDKDNGGSRTIIGDLLVVNKDQQTISTKGAQFILEANGDVKTVGDVSTNSYTLNTVGDNTVGIIREGDANSGGTRTVVEGLLTVNKDSKVMSYNGDVFHVGQNGDIKAAAGNFGIDSTGNVTLREKATVDGVDVSELSTAAKDISDLEDKTKYQYIAAENTTGFKGALNVEGNIRSAYGGFVVGDGSTSLHKGVLSLGAEAGQKLTAEQLVNINNVIQKDGNVVGTTVKTTSGADLDTVAQNTQHITHDEQGTHIEGMTIQQGDPGANLSGIYTINGASFEATNQNGGIKISGVTLEQGGINAYAPSNVGGVNFDGSGSMNSVNNINGVNFNELAQTVAGSSADVQHIKHYDDYAINGKGYDATVIEESVAITKDRGVDVIGGNGASVATITRQGTARFGAETGANVRIQDGGVYVNENYQKTVASLTGEGLTLGEQTLTEQKVSDIGGITRTGAPEYGYTTNIEGSFKVKSDGSFGTDNGSFVVNDLGEVSAANGEFFVNQNGAVTAQADSVIGDVRFSGGGDLNNVNHINGAAVQGWGEGGLEISGVAMENGTIKVTGINGAAVNAYGEGGLEISGVGMLKGNVSAQTFNGVSIEQNEEGSAVVGGIDLGNLNENLTGVAENVAGISRDDGKTTNIEGRVFVNKDEFYIGGYGDGSNWIRHDETGTTFGGKVTFNNGYNASFWYGDKQTTLGDLAYNLDDLTAQVQDIYDRTQGIDRDENGNTVISNDNRTWENGQSTVTDNGGATVTVGEDVTVAGGDLNVANGDLNVGYTEGSGTGGTGSSATGEGGNGNFAGDVNVGGSITVGDASNGVYTQVGESGLTAVNGNDTNNISSEGMTVKGEAGTNNISDAGMTITGIANEEGKAPTNNISSSGMTITGVDGSANNISSNGMTVGTTNIAKDSVSADKGTFGEGTFGSGEDQTVINNNGVTVGDKNDGTSIKHDEISVGDGGYIGGGDVVSGEGVSLNQTAERVGRLENKVGKLEDRIDKVGAMAAAIANLRTMGYDPAAPTEVAVGLGQYRDETGAALGLFHYPNRDFMLSLSVSTSGDEVMGGIGATWKFGRKSPEKVAEIKKAQAEADVRRAEAQKLAKAEELKAAAKEAKIKAQMERHAKLAAERAAETEAK